MYPFYKNFLYGFLLVSTFFSAAQSENSKVLPLGKSDGIVSYRVTESRHELLTSDADAEYEKMYSELMMVTLDPSFKETGRRKVSLNTLTADKTNINFVGYFAGNWVFLAETVTKAKPTRYGACLLSFGSSGVVKKTQLFETTEKPTPPSEFYLDGTFQISISPDSSKLALGFLAKKAVEVFAINNRFDLVSSKKIPYEDPNRYLASIAINNAGDIAAAVNQLSMNGDFDNLDIIFIAKGEYHAVSLKEEGKQLTNSRLFVGNTGGIQCLYLQTGKKDEKILRLCSISIGGKKDLDSKEATYLQYDYEFGHHVYSANGCYVTGERMVAGTQTDCYFNVVSCFIYNSKISQVQEVKRTVIQNNVFLPFLHKDKFYCMFVSHPEAPKVISSFNVAQNIYYAELPTSNPDKTVIDIKQATILGKFPPKDAFIVGYAGGSLYSWNRDKDGVHTLTKFPMP